MDNLKCSLLLLAFAAVFAASDAHGHGHGGTKMAKCTIKAASGDPMYPIEGFITFSQMKGDNVTIRVLLHGFNGTDGNMYHGFHIHERGDTGNKCKAAGGHYNPTSMDHGGPMDANRHVGDLGNIMENGSIVDITFTDHIISLEGSHSILNRAVVVHALEDDLGKMNNTGSKATGNAGKRLGCCVIKEAEKAKDTSNAHRAIIDSFMAVAALVYIKLITSL